MNVINRKELLNKMSKSEIISFYNSHLCDFARMKEEVNSCFDTLTDEELKADLKYIGVEV
jgi:hypothetical protein